MQRREPAAVVASPTGIAEATAPASPPGVEVITRPNWEPADRSPAPAESNAEAAPVAEERDVSRRPQRTIVRVAIHRSRPPSPRAVILEPAAIVIGRPAPGLIGNPS